MNIYGTISLILSIVAFFMVGNPAHIYLCLAIAIVALVLGIVGVCKSKTKKGIAIAGIIISVIVLLIAGKKLVTGILNYQEKKELSQTRNEQIQEEEERKKEENGLSNVKEGTILYADEYVEVKISDVGSDFISVDFTNNTESEIVVERTKVVVNGEVVELDGFESATIATGYSTTLQLLMDDLGIGKYESIKVSYKVYIGDKELVNIEELTILE